MQVLPSVRSLILLSKTSEMLSDTSSFDCLFAEFDHFSKNICNTSVVCKYFENCLYLISLVKNLVRADRDGEFILHMKTVGDLLPLFMDVMVLTMQDMPHFTSSLCKFKNKTPIPLPAVLSW